MPTDLTALTDTDLDNLRIAVLTEQERRQAATTMPAQIEDQAAQLTAILGDPQPAIDAATRGADRGVTKPA